MTIEQQRIQQLIKQDSNDSDQIEAYYDNAMSFISRHLELFYAHYSNETGITVSEAMQSVNSWDLKEWQAAIDELDVSHWLPEAQRRAQVLADNAGLNLGSMITSIASLGILWMINKQLRFTDQKMDDFSQDEQLFLRQQKHEHVKISQTVAKPKKIGKKPKRTNPKVKYGKPMISDRLWVQSDKLIDDVRSKLFNHFIHGDSIDDLRPMLIKHINPKLIDPNKSLADRIRQMNNIVETLLRSESQMMMADLDKASYKKNRIKYVNWATEPGVCGICAAIADDGPYLLEDAPMPVMDSHPRCRCRLVPYKE